MVQRARVIFEESKAGREQIIVTELPYQVNPSRVLQLIAELVNDRKLDGIADLRNETGRREGTRLVIAVSYTHLDVYKRQPIGAYLAEPDPELWLPIQPEDEQSPAASKLSLIHI